MRSLMFAAIAPALACTVVTQVAFCWSIEVPGP
jgi:hypothetical protein